MKIEESTYRKLHIISGFIAGTIYAFNESEDITEIWVLIIRFAHQFCDNYRPKISKDEIAVVLSDKLDKSVGLTSLEDEL